MKIAVLSDIHGNNTALEAVLKDINKQNINKILLLGDFVGYYYHPDKVLDLLKDFEVMAIKGNHEEFLRNSILDKQFAKNIYNKYGSGINQAINKLKPEQIEYLINLPEKITLNIDNLTFELCHGSPWDNNFYIYPDSDNSIVEKCTLSGADFVLIGHSHYPFIKEKNNTVIINPGSVGQSRVKGGTANYSIIDTEKKEFSLKETDYKVYDIIDEVKARDPHIEYLHKVLIRS